ncbi:Asx homology domain-containing protein [Trichoderma evansii]
MSTADSASADADSKLDHQKAEFPSSSPLSSHSELDSPLKPVRPRRKAAANKSYASPPRNEPKLLPQRQKRKPTATKRTAKKTKWDAESILKDPKSPLATANLRSILCNPLTWTALDQDERTEILSLFPDKGHILDAGTKDARPNFASLMNDDSFRYDCAAYTDNIAQGRHDPEWLASAWSAHERRRAGDFDKYLIDKLEEDWGVEIPEEMKIRRAPPVTEADNGEKPEKDELKKEKEKAEKDDLKKEKEKAKAKAKAKAKIDDRMEIDELAL